MKKILRKVLPVIIPLSLGFFGVKIYEKIQAKNVVAESIATLPAFSFTAMNNQQFSSSSITSNTVIINLFNPECEHCRYMAQSFVQHANEIKDIQILMVTIADSASVAKFANEYGINKLSNVTLLLDRNFQFEKIFGTSVVPSFFVYKGKKLVKKVTGETKIENLLSE